MGAHRSVLCTRCSMPCWGCCRPCWRYHSRYSSSPQQGGAIVSKLQRCQNTSGSKPTARYMRCDLTQPHRATVIAVLRRLRSVTTSTVAMPMKAVVPLEDAYHHSRLPPPPSPARFGPDLCEHSSAFGLVELRPNLAETGPAQSRLDMFRSVNAGSEAGHTLATFWQNLGRTQPGDLPG